MRLWKGVKSVPEEIKLTDNYTVEDDFIYFCNYDDRCGIVSSRCLELPAIADSCYVDVQDVFPP